MDVLGVFGDELLHRRLNDEDLWYVYASDANFVDSQRSYFKTNR